MGLHQQELFLFDFQVTVQKVMKCLKKHVPGCVAKRLCEYLQKAEGYSGKVKSPLLSSNASRSCSHLLEICWKLSSKKLFEGSRSLVLSETEPKSFAARSCESLEMPMLFSPMNFTILFATSSSFTIAQLQHNIIWCNIS